MPHKINMDQDISTNIYFGYYDKILIAVSQDKDILKSYLENNRNLNKKKYAIKSEFMNIYHYYSNYSDYILEELYSGLFLTNIDIQIIDSDNNNLLYDIKDLMENLYRMTRMINQVEKIKDDTEDFIKVMKHLKSYTEKEKIYKKLDDINYKSHPIISCDIKEYLHLISRFKEIRNMNEMYKTACREDN